MKKDILITGKGGFIGSRIRGGKAFQGNISSVDAILAQTIGVSGIVHLAAVSSNRACEDNPRECFRVNLLFLCDILEVAMMRKLWVIFISSFQAGDPGMYGLTKLAGEELCRIYQKMGLRVRILRLPIVYGPKDKSHKVVTKIISEIRKGQIPKIKTHKKFYFAYVDNVARKIENEVELINFRPGKKYSLYDLMDGIKKCMPRKGGKA